jgi:cyclic beta-1,2-glucan synthetase
MIMKLSVLMGWALALFLVNVVVAQFIAWLNRRSAVKGWAVYGWLALPALAVVMAPAIADFGSGAPVASLPALVRSAVAVLCTMASQAALWAEAFLLTGLVLDGMRGEVPDRNIVLGNSKCGMLKGAAFSGILMGLLQLTSNLVSMKLVQEAYQHVPYLLLAVAGALLFPLFKTIIETFDGSHSFFRRAALAYRKPDLYVRGLVVGLAVAVALGMKLPTRDTGLRMGFGVAAGLLAFAGVSLARDAVLGLRGRGGIKSVRPYLVDACMGGFIGGALAFYFDVNQVPILLTKFNLYTSFGMNPDALVTACNNVRTTRPDEFRLLLGNWGYIQLTAVSGGTKMLLNEAIIGVSVWGIAAWLFAINRAFLQACFDRSWKPVRQIASKEGVADLVEGTIRVMRWGLWMSPVIFSFLRPMGTPTWYNQDGAIRSLFATANRVFMGDQAFNAWSLGVFTWILVYGGFRILIFLDHMGLRVATLVNLSFIGMDRLDEKVARFIGPDAAARYIPEGVKRFTTWAPLLIPFYLPAGTEWDKVWSESQAILAKTGGRIDVSLAALGAFTLLMIAVFLVCRRHARSKSKTGRRLCISNLSYEVELKPSGEANSRLIHQNVMVTRPAYEGIEPAGRALFLSEITAAGDTRSWPVLGNHPAELFPKAIVTAGTHKLKIVQTANELQATLLISLPDGKAAAERWDLSVENLSDRPRDLNVSPYLEWLLCGAGDDRNHTQYNRLYPEMSYDCALNAVLALHHLSRKVGFVAASTPPAGFLTGRVDFIGRAGTLWDPRALRTRCFLPCRNTDAYPTFDPIGALQLGLTVAPKGRATVSFLVGCADSHQQAADWIKSFLAPEIRAGLPAETGPARHPMIGHGEIHPGTDLPYTEYEDAGATLHVRTPFTPRPFDHTMSNALGHVLCVTNRGLHTSASGNAQQNRLTTDWADVVTRELPAEAFYLYDESAKAWFSPTYEPLRDPAAKHDVRFSLDGSAIFTMRKDWLETELTTHVPIDAPTGVYLLTLRNRGSASRRLRVAPYFQIALAHSPEMAGKLEIQNDAGGALFFQNRNNTFRSGPAFVAMSHPAMAVATERGAFFGAGRSFAHPVFVETGKAAAAGGDAMACAALVAELELPANGEATIAVLLGQTDTMEQARACIANLNSVSQAQGSLARTREWWRRFVSTVRVKTSDAEFDGYVNWMKYQALAERIWARKGFYQASGAFGFRDQLQDAVNLIWVDPALARRQLRLHAAQQFREGDVAHWFFTLQDGRTGFVSRSHASDNLLWLAWGIAEYVRMSGDTRLLDEPVTYLDCEILLPPLPQGKHGMGFYPLRSPVADSIYAHVMKAIDLVLEKRMGASGLPLIGTGDWNDGLDEIGSEGRGESVWMAFFLTCILKNLLATIEQRDGAQRREHYEQKLEALTVAVEKTWRRDRYLRAIHDDGTEIGVEGAGYWEADALTAAWAVYSGINMERGRIAMDTALRILETDNTISLGYPPLRTDTKPYLGRSCLYPEGVRENGMYSHGVQWLIGACRLLSEQSAAAGDADTARHYRDASARLWYKIAAISHTTPEEIEVYGGQPNKQCADCLTKFDRGRMIWNGYTGAAGWMFRQAIEGVMGATLVNGEVRLPGDFDLPRGNLACKEVKRDVALSPLEKVQ